MDHDKRFHFALLAAPVYTYERVYEYAVRINTIWICATFSMFHAQNFFILRETRRGVKKNHTPVIYCLPDVHTRLKMNLAILLLYIWNDVIFIIRSNLTLVRAL